MASEVREAIILHRIDFVLYVTVTGKKVDTGNSITDHLT